MPRKAGGPPAGKVTRYTPTAYKNRDAPEADRVHVTIRYPSAQEKREVQADAGAIRFSLGEDGEPAKDEHGNHIVEVDTGEISRRNHALITRFVESVENYIDQAGEPIDTGEKLARHGEDAIVTEVAEEIWRGVSLTVDEGKDCAGSPDSSPAATSPSPLTVANAGATDGTVDATADAPMSYETTES